MNLPSKTEMLAIGRPSYGACVNAYCARENLDVAQHFFKGSTSPEKVILDNWYNTTYPKTKSAFVAQTAQAEIAAHFEELDNALGNF